MINNFCNQISKLLLFIWNVEITTRFNNLLMINFVGNYFINKFIDGNCPSKKISSVISSLSVSSLLIKNNLLIVL